VLPLDQFRVENSELLFEDLGVVYGFSAPRQYQIRWSRFDNLTHRRDPLPDGPSRRLPAEITRAASGSYFCAVIDAGGPLDSVYVYLRKEGEQFKVVGVERRVVNRGRI
jgi:hypothetical protein